MAHGGTSFPFFVATEPRSLSGHERAVVDRLLLGRANKYVEQVSRLQVVGRCGCEACPTVFFLTHQQDEQEADLVTMAGKDHSGLVAAVLTERAGALCQLEFYSVDGHEPWEIPDAETLAAL